MDSVMRLRSSMRRALRSAIVRHESQARSAFSSADSTSAKYLSNSSVAAPHADKRSRNTKPAATDAWENFWISRLFMARFSL